MKIIAISKPHSSAEHQSYLIEATGTEIVRLFGEQNLQGPYVSRGLPSDKLRIGTEIDVDAAYKYLEWIYRHRDRFEGIAKQLRQAAASIDRFPELFSELSIPEADDIKKAG